MGAAEILRPWHVGVDELARRHHGGGLELAGDAEEAGWGGGGFQRRLAGHWCAAATG